MKITKAMDAGDIYSQQTVPILSTDDKFTLCDKLTIIGANLIVDTLKNVTENTARTTTQDNYKATYTIKLDKSLSKLQPHLKAASQLDREIRAYLSFPKSKYIFFNTECTILKAHSAISPKTEIDLKCADGNYLIIDQLQPASRKPMSASDFLRGYAKK
jgi:methionyl-tRNA formyltransferase